MDCATARRLTTRRADRELPDDEREALTAHLRSCDDCASRRETDAGLSQLLQGLDVPDPGEEYWSALASSVRGEVADRRPALGLRLLRSRPALAIAAGLILVLGLGIVAGLFRGQDVIAATLDAMADVKTAHIVGTSDAGRWESWYSAEHGLRTDGARYLRVATDEAQWEYDADDGTVLISAPDPDGIQGYLQRLSATRLLETLRSDPERYEYTISDTTLDGAAVKRIDAEAHVMGEMKGTLWIDPASMRVLASEDFEQDADGAWHLISRMRAEYDVLVDPSLFVFEPPEDARVIDTRLDDDMRAVINDAGEALRTWPIREEGWAVERFVGDLERRWDEPDEWVAWRLNGEGSREEHAGGRVVIRTPDELVQWWGGDYACIQDNHDPYGDPSPVRPMALQHVQELSSGTMWGRLLDGPPSVTREERGGRRVACVTVEGEHTYDICRPSDRDDVGFEFAGTGQERQRRVLTFDLDARRLIRCEHYVLEDGEWRLSERLELEYPEELPEGVFEFHPPPGTTVDRDTD